MLFLRQCAIIDEAIIVNHIDNESWIYCGDLENMRKIIVVSIGIISLLLCACTLQTSDSSIIPENISSMEGETNMLTIDDIISDVPKNASYRKTILQSYPSGGKSRWDTFYDEYNNEICDFCTSDILNHSDPDFALSEDSPFRSTTFYIYNAEGTMLKRTFCFMDVVRETRFEYNEDNILTCEVRSENGIEGTTVLYENDEHGNPVIAKSIVEGELVQIDEYEYQYNENGNITYKVWKSGEYEYQYDENGHITNKVWKSEELIYYYWYEYDEHGNLTMEKEFREGADFPSYEKYFYDDNDRLIRQESYLNDEPLSESIFEYEFYD